MQFDVQPRGFSVAETKIPTDAGLVDGMRFTIIDISGIAVNVTFALPDWESFQRYVADPVAESARLEARAKLVGPGGMASKLPRKIN